MNGTYPSHIVRQMKKLALLLTISLVCAAPAFAQSSEFGILLGGSKRLISDKDVEDNVGVNDRWRFDSSVREVWYAVEIEPSTRFKIKAGQIIAPGAFQVNEQRFDVEDADVDHIDGIVEYRFSEPFGSTGLFAGVGLYRQSAEGFDDETNYGFQIGVNGDFPINRRLGFVLEASYHAVNYHYRPRYVTVGGGLRFSF